MIDPKASTDAYRTALTACYQQVAQIFDLPLETLAGMIEHAESVGPLLDPTLYRANATKMAQDKVIIQGLLRLKQRLPQEMQTIFTAMARVVAARKLVEETK